MGGDVFYRGMSFTVPDMPCLGGVYHGLCHRMGKMFFQTGGNFERRAFRKAVIRDNPCQCRGGKGQGASFIKHDGIAAGKFFQRRTALEKNAVFQPFTNRGKKRQRRGKFYRTGIIHRKHRGGLPSIMRKKPGQRGGGKGNGGCLVRNTSRPYLRIRLRPLGLFDKPDNPFITGLLAHFLHFRQEFPFGNDGSGMEKAARCFFHR